MHKYLDDQSSSVLYFIPLYLCYFAFKLYLMQHTQCHVPEDGKNSFNDHYCENVKSHHILLLVCEYAFASTILFSVRRKKAEEFIK